MIDISTLSLQEKIGQMVMCGFKGHEPSKNIKQLIQEHSIGGVIYFARNVQRPRQLLELSKELQVIATKSKSGLPLFIAIDQEGGMVARITEGVTLMPGNMALGAAKDEQGVYQAAYRSGQELRALGINMNFAPCLDVNNNPLNPVIGVRSYGEDVELVSSFGLKAIEGYQNAGISATIKHFPGHGDTTVDSHLDLPQIPHDLERLHQLELVPFKRAIEAGVDAIMTAHVVFPAFEAKKPATLSAPMITGLLREELQYDGLIVTDCMEMKAIVDYFGVEEAAVLAVEAGVDLVLVSHSFERQVGTLQALIQAVESGRIPEERINQSVQRILFYKNKRNLAQRLGEWDEVEQSLASRENLELARRLSEKSITLVRDELGCLPLSTEKKTLIVWPEIQVQTEVDETFGQPLTLGYYLSQKIKGTEEIVVSTNPSLEEIERIVEHSSAAAYSQIVVATYNATSNAGQAELVKSLMSSQESAKLIVASLRSPYDVQMFPNVPTYLCCYESRARALQSLAKVLIGELQAEGQLPVTLF